MKILNRDVIFKGEIGGGSVPSKYLGSNVKVALRLKNPGESWDERKVRTLAAFSKKSTQVEDTDSESGDRVMLLSRKED